MKCLTNVFIDFSFNISSVDCSLLYCHHNGHGLFCIVYVYDILITGDNSSLIQSILIVLNNHLKVCDMSHIDYFHRIKVNRTSNAMFLMHQKIYYRFVVSGEYNLL